MEKCVCCHIIIRLCSFIYCWLILWSRTYWFSDLSCTKILDNYNNHAQNVEWRNRCFAYKRQVDSKFLNCFVNIKLWDIETIGTQCVWIWWKCIQQMLIHFVFRFATLTIKHVHLFKKNSLAKTICIVVLVYNAIVNWPIKKLICACVPHHDVVAQFYFF